MNYQYIGKSTPVNNSRAKASGLLRYAGDMKLPNMLHMKLVLSPVALGSSKRSTPPPHLRCQALLRYCRLKIRWTLNTIAVAFASARMS